MRACRPCVTGADNLSIHAPIGSSDHLESQRTQKGGGRKRQHPGDHDMELAVQTALEKSNTAMMPIVFCGRCTNFSNARCDGGGKMDVPRPGAPLEVFYAIGPLGQQGPSWLAGAFPTVGSDRDSSSYECGASTHTPSPIA